MISPPNWISLRAAFEHVLEHRHSPPLAAKALREVLINGQVAARAEIYHVVPHPALRQAPQAARDHFIAPERWAGFDIDWVRSSLSQQASATAQSWGVWESSGKKFPSSWLYTPAIQAFGVTVSDQQVLAIWPAVQAKAEASRGTGTAKLGRPKGTGYHAADAAALEEMERLRQTGHAKSVTDAARQVVLGKNFPHLEGNSNDSIIVRLTRRYRRNQRPDN